MMKRQKCYEIWTGNITYTNWHRPTRSYYKYTQTDSNTKSHSQTQCIAVERSIQRIRKKEKNDVTHTLRSPLPYSVFITVPSVQTQCDCARLVLCFRMHGAHSQTPMSANEFRSIPNTKITTTKIWHFQCTILYTTNTKFGNTQFFNNVFIKDSLIKLNNKYSFQLM